MINLLESRTTCFRPVFHLDISSRKGELTKKFSEQQYNWRPRITTELEFVAVEARMVGHPKGRAFSM
jgi:hypothetical protein